MIELAIALGRPLDELTALDDVEVATLVSIVEARNRG